jgi:carbon monoxide dehydrogenase subunit G
LAAREFSRTVRIERPREEVWAFMTTLSNSPKWITGVKETKQVSPGPMAAGARLTETRTLGKYTETYEIEVKEFDAPKRYAAGAKAGKAEFVYTFELKEAGAATEVTMRATMDGRGLAFKMFAGMGLKMMEKYDGDQLERLKAAAEGAPQAAGATPKAS